MIVTCISDTHNKHKDIKPKIRIFGHIHECHRIQKFDNCLFINASQLDETYKLVYNLIKLEFKNGDFNEI